MKLRPIVFVVACLTVACVSKVAPPRPPAPVVTYPVACVVVDVDSQAPITGASCATQGASATTNADGYALLPKAFGAGSGVMAASRDGYDSGKSAYALPAANANIRVALKRQFPAPPTRDQILDAHESFQGAILHTAQFGDLYWWPTAWVSLNAADRASSYAQIASWGDTDITVSASWNYGEAGQPYGDGQLVPNTDYVASNRLTTDFRAAVKDVILHTAANGQPFVPRIFMEGDNGFTYYMWAMPQIIAALKPQPGDPIDLTPYVKLQMCYDSCVPGYAGAKDDKSLINDAILGTRTACPNCVISLEFATGYSSTGDGDAWWQTDAGKAIDEVDWEGNTWPPNNYEQYWEILDRWLGPAYIRPPQQQSDADAPFPLTNAKFYLRNGTPRGAYRVHCYEPFTYDWVRGRVAVDQVPVARRAMQALGCAVVDVPVQ